MQRHYSPQDRLIAGVDKVLSTLSPGTQVRARAIPRSEQPQGKLSPEERRRSSGLMRVNHSGEVCAQALYQGQALTAKLNNVREQLVDAAEEEVDHLAWCEARLQELDSRPSLLNPLWYAASFALGAGAGLISDKVSLGFVAATEDNVSEHLRDHLKRLPEHDHASRAIVEQMLEDEQAHAQTAKNAGAMAFPSPVKAMMRGVSKVMTKSSYYL